MRRLMESKRDREIYDLPAVRLNEARFILGMGENRWRRVWDAVYQYKVEHFEKGLTTWLNLDSLVGQVFPAIAKNSFHRAMVAHNFMWEIVRMRNDHKIQKLKAKLKKCESDEGE